MAERTEEQLARALKAAANLAPGPVGDLTLSIAARRSRRRRRRLQTTLAVTGVIVVIGGGMTVMRGTFLEHRGGGLAVELEARASLTPTPPVAPPSFASAAEVWPEAVFRIPARAEDGAEYRPVMALSATEVLVTAKSSYRADRLEVYDSATKSMRTLAWMPGMFAASSVQGWDADSRHIVWYRTTMDPLGGSTTQFYLLPRDGGPPRVVFALYGDDADKVEKVAIAEDRLAYSLSTGGVFTMPLRGAKNPTPVPGSEGLFLQRWPWAGDKPGRYVNDTGNQSLLVNLVTGERRPVRAGDAQGLRCGPNWCVGERSHDERMMSAVVQRVDGGDRQELRLLRSFPTLDGVIADRFAVLTVSGVVGWDPSAEAVEKESAPVAVVYDRATGAKAAVGARAKDGGGSFGRGTSSAPSNIVYWNAGRSAKPKEYQVLNLAAVR